MPFLARLRVAVEWAVLTGVKIAILLVFAIVAIAWALGDYNIVRQRAYNGQVAFEWIQQQQKAK